MPQRTRSKRAEGRRMAAAELARWRTSGSSPAEAASARASRKAASWASLAGCSGSSLAAKCDQMPVRARRPSRSRSLAATNRSCHSDRGAPPRESPVSTLICTRGRRPVPDSAASSVSSATEYAVTSMSAATAAARSSPGAVSQHSTRPESPLARTASADGRHPEPRGSSRTCCARGLGQPVAVAVRLDHDHQLHRPVLGDEVAQDTHVVADGSDVDDDLGARMHGIAHASESPNR